eukprot:TRINITY_DN20635_c0_g1_i1.p1 TRINITY_DN20635_c0_g1~~TRINITY_DN20635_c0_g1_i1.p1  ORF type:complete len:264 (+),score=28.36 TRINITY_DN20635_c0_g1_i1:147-938(+)
MADVASAKPSKRFAVFVFDRLGIKKDAVLVPVRGGVTVADVIKEVKSRVPQHADLVQELRLTSCSTSSLLLLDPKDRVDEVLRDMDEVRAAPVGTELCAMRSRIGAYSPSRSTLIDCSPSVRSSVKRKATFATPERSVQEASFKKRMHSPKRDGDAPWVEDVGYRGGRSSGEGAATAVAREKSPLVRHPAPDLRRRLSPCVERRARVQRRDLKHRPHGNGCRSAGNKRWYTKLREWWQQVTLPLIITFANPQLLCAHRAGCSS